MRTLNLLRSASALAGPTHSLCRARCQKSIRLALASGRAHRALPAKSLGGFSITLRKRYSTAASATTTTTTTASASPGNAAAPEQKQTADEKKSGPDDDAKPKDGKRAKPAIKTKRYWKVLFILVEICIGDYLFDRYVLGGVMLRTTIAYAVLARVGLDYKLHYGHNCWLARHPDEDLHHRNAQRVCTMLKHNGGLYLKAGQAAAMQGSVLPEEYQRMFGEMFDDAPKSSWSDVEKVIKQDFGGRSVEEVFGVAADGTGSQGSSVYTFEQEPRASASIAQVHYARLPDGRALAVKVQRREIAKQVSWDLWSMKLMAEYTAWVTGLPMGGMGQYVADRVMQETDFEHEAGNSEKMASLIASDSSLRDSVYIPKVYRELTSKRVLTTEWVDAVQLWDKDGITGTHRSPSSVAGNTSHPHGLGLQLSDVMQTVVELFSTQMFSWGFVHCDPHPGNILVRRNPNGSGKAQVVLLDHGLYITMSDKLRRQYARFWKALITNDDASLQKVSHEWGMKNADAWADASLMRPYKNPAATEGDGGSAWRRTKETAEERQQRMIDEAAAYLGEEGLFPRELLFLERNITIVQGNNRFLGSPINRIKLIGMCALRAVRDDGGDHATLRQALSVRLTLVSLDMAFWWSRIKQYFGYGEGFEQELKDAEDRQLRETKDAVAELFGITLD
ncbi:ABC1 family protein C10F6.14c [Tolypocladium ophioglossoides CBS 100239]|uniref:ABC1 family protein C10F6.14c n=1 Tax=Tolypocladium ophioglossoides (strain CBS 100239) TaxID=1163406 RepID=A0A0L0MZG5_TOLOC|nr:ABC1 family protein C10F6.14c [Tolypocladium ophioglossoides CBS 100239]